MEAIVQAVFEDGFWRGIERLSWISQLLGAAVAVVGIPLAVAQLRHASAEQKRIADELARRPRFIVGFGHDVGPQLDLKVRPETPFSTVVLNTGNDGNRSANYVNTTFIMDGVIKTPNDSALPYYDPVDR